MKGDAAMISILQWIGFSSFKQDVVYCRAVWVHHTNTLGSLDFPVEREGSDNT
jgi:hypothetical protein